MRSFLISLLAAQVFAASLSSKVYSSSDCTGSTTLDQSIGGLTADGTCQEKTENGATVYYSAPADCSTISIYPATHRFGAFADPHSLRRGRSNAQPRAPRQRTCTSPVMATMDCGRSSSTAAPWREGNGGDRWLRGCVRDPRPKFRLAKLLWPACPAGRNNCAHAKVVPSDISLVREPVVE